MFPGELLFYKVKYSNTRQQSDYDYDVSEYCFSIGKLVSKISNRTSYNYAPLTANVSTAIFVLSNLGNYFSNCCIKQFSFDTVQKLVINIWILFCQIFSARVVGRDDFRTNLLKLYSSRRAWLPYAPTFPAVEAIQRHQDPHTLPNFMVRAMTLYYFHLHTAPLSTHSSLTWFLPVNILHSSIFCAHSFTQLIIMYRFHVPNIMYCNCH